MRRVVVFGLGGTIAVSGGEPVLGASELVAAVPGLDQLAVDVEVVDFRRLPGASLDFADLRELATAVEQRLAAGDVDGVVVTQGTDTIEEAAYALDLLHARPEPLVVTGAMRNPTLAGADGPANLLAAIQVAASADVQDQGCLVVFADEIHAASRVRKAHSSRLMAFESPDGGPLGYVVAGTARVLNRRPARPWFPPLQTSDPRVALVAASLGDDGAALAAIHPAPAAAAEGYQGLVVAGFGVGHVPGSWVDRLAALAERIPVVLASRTGAGPVLPSGYTFPGSETQLLAAGLVAAGFLDPYKARILLHLLLAAGADSEAIADAFGVAGGYRPVDRWPFGQDPW